MSITLEAVYNPKDHNKTSFPLFLLIMEVFNKLQWLIHHIFNDISLISHFQISLKLIAHRRLQLNSFPAMLLTHAYSLRWLIFSSRHQYGGNTLLQSLHDWWRVSKSRWDSHKICFLFRLRTGLWQKAQTNLPDILFTLQQAPYALIAVSYTHLTLPTILLV